MSEQESKSCTVEDLYAVFEMDESLEKNGVLVNYGRFKVGLARAGGSNLDYANTFEAVFKDVKTALEIGELDEQDARRRYYTVFARSVIRTWLFLDTDKQWVRGLGRDKAGNIVEATEANLIALWTKRHDLFIKIRKDAEQMELFQNLNREAVAKN